LRGTHQRAVRSAAARQRARRLSRAQRPTHRPHYRRIVLAGLLLTLVSAAAAYGVVSLLIGSGGQASASNKGPAWLGVDMASSAFGSGALVIDVIPGSPAGEAGIEPGDVITQVDNRPVASPDQFNSAISGLHVGEQIQLQVLRGPVTFTTQATLVTRPAGSP
jgi:S1-C subfamily serine protease